MEQFVTIQRAAEMLSVSQDTVRRLIDRGSVRTVDLMQGQGGKRLLRISAKSLESYLHSCMVLPLVSGRAAAPADFRIARRRA